MEQRKSAVVMEDLNNSSQHKFSMERGGGHKAPPLDEELLVIDNCRERESVFFKNVVSEKKKKHWSYIAQ